MRPSDIPRLIEEAQRLTGEAREAANVELGRHVLTLLPALLSAVIVRAQIMCRSCASPAVGIYHTPAMAGTDPVRALCAKHFEQLGPGRATLICELAES